jgi:sugar lactone lactonase YvrE
MKSRLLLMLLGLTVFSVVIVVGQGQAPAPAAAAAPLQQGPGVQAPNDARYADWVTMKCKMPPTIAPPRGAPAGGARAPEAPQKAAYTVTEIPGIIAAGAQWTTVWTGRGNNADGIISVKGGIYAAQNTDSKIMQIDKDGKVSFPYTDTATSGSISINKKGKTFIASRMLPAGIFELDGKNKKPFATLMNNEPIDCIGGVLNDLVAAEHGGVYFTMGPRGASGVYYADKKGVVSRQGTVVGTNGLALSPDEKTLYVTGSIASSPAAAAPARGAAPAPGTGGNMVAFTVQADGTLTNERQFATVGNDGATVDAMGRVYVTQGATVQIVGPDGKFIGAIPAPLGLITVVISGPDKKTLYGVANNQQFDEIFTIPILAQGYKDRGK